MAVRWWSIRYNIMSPTEVDLHKLPEPVKKVARPVVRPVRKAAQHVSAKTSQAAEQAACAKSSVSTSAIASGRPTAIDASR